MLEGQPGLQQSEVLTIQSCPELFAIKDKVTGSDHELTVAVIDTLMDTFNLAAIDHIFMLNKQWDGLSRKPTIEDRAIGKDTSYDIKLKPKMLPSKQISLRLIISGMKMETAIDQELILDVGNPVIVGVPNTGRAYFAMVVVKTESQAEIKPKSKETEKVDLVTAPKAIHQVKPFFPNELRRHGIGGEIGLRIIIDREGNVRQVEVTKPLHPYHNYSAVQAFLKWKFEPVLEKGKPVPAMFLFTYNFDPWMYLQEREWSDTLQERSDSSDKKELREVLAGSGDYCHRLKSAAFDFICEETIKETHYNLLDNINQVVWSKRRRKSSSLPTYIKPSEAMKYSVASEARSVKEDAGGGIFLRDDGPSGGTIKGTFQIIDPQRTLRNSFLCDYQLINETGIIKEQRIVLKENGKKPTEKKNLLNERRFSGVSSLYAPIQVLALDRQANFNYQIIDEKKLFGKKVHVVEAIPKLGNENGIWSAKIWIDKMNFQVLKCEIEGIPIYGYEDVLNDCAILNIKPKFVITHEYRKEKSKIRFPSGSKIRVDYPGIDSRGTSPKINMNLTYDKHKFFQVETDHKIIK